LSNKEKYVLDTSIIIEGEILSLLESHNIQQGSEIIIPVSVFDELQSQASTNRETGFVGLNAIKSLREECKRKNISMRLAGERPQIDDIRLAKQGRIDAMIKDVAMKERAILVTGDYVQALAAEAQGIECIYKMTMKSQNFRFERFFDQNTMSVHLKEDVQPMAKKGKPGNFELVSVGMEKSKKSELKEIIKEITELSRHRGIASLEISRIGAKVIQCGNFRIAITEPPFSEAIEVTIVRPITRLSLAEYNSNEKLVARLSERAEGVLISGPPGSGKSTLASSLAEFYIEKKKIVKTFESPRDLQVPKEVTQYGPLDGSFENAVDILLLVRPDYTIFDEIRKTADFRVFSDMRLAGVGMIGVIHASSSLDAIQRFIGRVDLGMIPHILDTIIFVKDGKIQKVYDISLTVKVPSGMIEADLARPLVEVKDFDTGVVEYEIYTYGEENVVVPVKQPPKNGESQSSIKKLAESKIKDVMRRFDPNAEIKIITENSVQIKVAKEMIPRIIGRGGSTVSDLEKMLGLRINVEEKDVSVGNGIDFELKEDGSCFNITVDNEQIGKKANVYIEDDFIFNSQIGKKCRIKIDKRSESGKKLIEAISADERIRIFCE
jgi:ATPase